ncbi:hypothetical protein HMPREF1148_0236 [Selenomonas sp. FOBRC6]|nr:hypothetical protein HMPREF1148_0236 [Selenomonas sp. FOBRC6]
MWRFVQESVAARTNMKEDSYIKVKRYSFIHVLLSFIQKEMQ